MKNIIIVNAQFDGTWPFVADEVHRLWSLREPVALIRVGEAASASEVVKGHPDVEQLVNLGIHVSVDCLGLLPQLREICSKDVIDQDDAALSGLGVAVHSVRSEGYWGQSVSEFALALTLSALRRIPQLHAAMKTDLSVWDYSPPGGVGQPGARGQQFGDDLNFSHGTLAGKRVRIVGAGNIGSRYASFCHALGAEVAAWDPLAAEPCFHRTGARRVWDLPSLVQDAEIFAPMLPLRLETEGIVTAQDIDQLPKGCLVIQVTRAAICDMPALRRRVLAGELALAADVFEIEPLQLDDPLLGLDHVIHTPHNAGRTRDANYALAAALLEPILKGR